VCIAICCPRWSTRRRRRLLSTACFVRSAAAGPRRTRTKRRRVGGWALERPAGREAGSKRSSRTQRRDVWVTGGPQEVQAGRRGTRCLAARTGGPPGLEATLRAVVVAKDMQRESGVWVIEGLGSVGEAYPCQGKTGPCPRSLGYFTKVYGWMDGWMDVNVCIWMLGR
jgi:hypothetical protein